MDANKKSHSSESEQEIKEGGSTGNSVGETDANQKKTHSSDSEEELEGSTGVDVKKRKRSPADAETADNHVFWSTLQDGGLRFYLSEDQASTLINKKPEEQTTSFIAQDHDTEKKYVLDVIKPERYYLGGAGWIQFIKDGGLEAGSDVGFSKDDDGNSLIFVLDANQKKTHISDSEEEIEGSTGFDVKKRKRSPADAETSGKEETRDEDEE